ncbi:MAG: TerC family protein [Aurantimicrobium sp.]|nr:TerC family protein [Aurantimicrobium sp.]
MDGALPFAFEVISLSVLLVILIVDLFLVVWRPHVPSMRESALWVTGYALLAVIFGGLIFFIGDAQISTEFFAGWLTEYSLSIDNLFVFVIIMARFAVPPKMQQEVLMIGIIMALVLRAIFILLGAALIASFSWVFYIFGAFLIYTAIHQAVRSGQQEEETENKLIGWLRKRISITDTYNGIKLRTTVIVKEGGKSVTKRMLTPMLLVLISLAVTDVIFAFDSIPAIFGITTSPFIVFVANVFALMGLRQLYFLLGGLIKKLHYLTYGIAVILAFIGVKLVLHALHDNTLPFINGGEHLDGIPEISTEVSLIVIVAAIAVSALASVWKMRRDDRAEKESASTKK